MSYDSAGNVLTDTYNGAGARVYDADNRMTQANGGATRYTYNADGQRTRRNINNQETWQVYGVDGELLAEYPANGTATLPQKENAVTAPTTPGTYNFHWRMVQDYVEWFGDTSTHVAVTVTTQGPPQVHWLVPDHVGTPRIILDQTRSLANVKRHDYLPFDEELFAGSRGRTNTQGYSGGDAVRQQFTATERDVDGA